MTFSSLGLAEPLVRGLPYLVPTAIQQAAVPVILRGRDLWASAPTGSGKTAAFALPILQIVSAARRSRSVAALVLVPTRELARQVTQSFRTYGLHLPEPVKTAIAFGGVSINPQMMALRGGADIVVATPGRLLDLVARRALSLAALAVLVLDEADRLLALGFADELARIVALLPARRQTLLFSATFPPAVQALAQQLLREPARLDLAAAPTDPPAIEQRAIEVDRARRTPLLRHLLAEHAWLRVLVFTATKYGAGHLAEKLRQTGVAAAPLHGELGQGARTRALADFKAGKIRVLVATDVAARGLDITALPAVVNYDLPRSATDYVHRIGRTGRAGESGVAVSFVSAETHAHFQLIEKRHGLDLPREQIAGFEPVEISIPLPAGGVKGTRRSKKDKLRAAAARP